MADIEQLPYKALTWTRDGNLLKSLKLLGPAKQITYMHVLVLTHRRPTYLDVGVRGLHHAFGGCGGQQVEGKVKPALKENLKGKMKLDLKTGAPYDHPLEGPELKRRGSEQMP